MTNTKGISRTSKIFCFMGSALLLIMGVFHGSGFLYVREAIQESNAEEFLKEIVPALFAHPSIHLIGLSAFGILALFLKQDLRKVTWLLAALIVLDALLAFYLGGMLPSLMLLTAAVCFAIAGFKEKPAQVDAPINSK